MCDDDDDEDDDYVGGDDVSCCACFRCVWPWPSLYGTIKNVLR